MMKTVTLLITLLTAVSGQWDPNYVPGRSVMVHLFEWPWTSIAEECENWLGPKGFGGVQISPPTENLIVNTRPWWERFQPISYNFITRSGNEAELQDMIRRCNNVGVRIYATVVINHMTVPVDSGFGTGGSTCSGQSYPAVPYAPMDFHVYCIVNGTSNVLKCGRNGTNDLEQSHDFVRGKIANMLNRLISFGVAGLYVDSGKYMWPGDLDAIFGRLTTLNTDHGFESGTHAFVVLDSIEFVSGTSYLARSTEYRFSEEICKAFDGSTALNLLIDWGEAWGFAPNDTAFVFVDNHENQRGFDGTDVSFCRNDPRVYKMATAFKLAHTYGSVSCMMSSFDFGTNIDQGPPQDSNGNINPPGFNPDGSCTNGWVCEHRWRQMYNMVEFKNVVAGTIINNWWDNGNNQIAFCRGDKGFIAWNNEGYNMNVNLQTCLPAGTYCDVISGSKSGNSCTGKTVTVVSDGTADIVIGINGEDGVLAIHANDKRVCQGSAGLGRSGQQYFSSVQQALPSV